jgi:hypothetical protein
MSRTIIEQIRQAVLHCEHEHLWDERVIDPDTWTDEQIDSAEAVVSTVLSILDDFEKVGRTA